MPVLPVSCVDITEGDIKGIIASLLYQFPVREVELDLPGWVTALPVDDWLLSAVLDTLRKVGDISKMCQVKPMLEAVEGCPYIRSVGVRQIDLGSGRGQAEATFDQGLFYRVLGEQTGLSIQDEAELLRQLVEMTEVKKKFQKLQQAYDDVLETGYGIVMPEVEELTLEEPPDLKAERQVRHPAQGHRPLHPHDAHPDLHGDHPHRGVGAAVGRTGAVPLKGV